MLDNREDESKLSSCLKAENVSVRYGERLVVRQVTTTCESNSIVGVLGPNGAGKTSFLKTLAGLATYEGRITYGGRDIHSLSPSERAQNITYVPQRSLLDADLSVREVVSQGRYCHRGGWMGSMSATDHAAVSHALKSVDAEAFSARSYRRLSGGEQRRILLARALATESRVILLDEPTGSLDIAHSLAFFQTLRLLAEEGKTIVCVLHDLADAAAHCDRLLLLKNGETRAYGAPRTVIRQSYVQEVYGVELVEDEGFSYRLPKAEL